MRSFNTAIYAGLLSATAGLLLLAGCVDEQVVYRDRELFAPVPSGAASYVGYTDEATKLTVCGNCHVDHQAKWEGTKHAGAWADLQASGHATSVCEACHTVNPNGNVGQGEGGWTATQDPRYHDVQCESCHGPGLNHVQDPESGQPLAALSVGVDLTLGCGQCHSGTHHPFVEEWAQSKHANLEGHTLGNASCAGCHTGEGALAAWGVNSNYLEKDSLDPTSTDPAAHIPITCGICHDPHAKNNEHQLRFPIDVPSEEENLCMRCHHKRGTPDPTTFRGPHSPEGPTLLGYAGWWPPSLQFATDTIVATHGSERNPSLCATCHVASFAVTDPNTGSVTFNATGHLFAAIPCIDQNGLPTTNDCDLSQRTFAACTASGCHGSEAVARSLMEVDEQRIEELTNELDAVLEEVQPNWKACRASDSCPAGSPFNGTDGKFTTAEGAAFNYDLALAPGGVVHNPFLLEALVTASIKQVEQDYNVPAQSSVSLQRLLGKVK